KCVRLYFGASVRRHFGMVSQAPNHYLKKLRQRVVDRMVAIPSGIEESPGSRDRLPGNSWAQRCILPSTAERKFCDGQCHRKQTAKYAILVFGKGEKVG